MSNEELVKLCGQIINHVQTDLGGIKMDTSALRTEVSSLKAETAALKTDMSWVKKLSWSLLTVVTTTLIAIIVDLLKSLKLA